MLSLSPFYQDLLSALNRGLLMSVALIVPSACGGVLIGIATGAIRAFGIPWMRAVGEVSTVTVPWPGTRRTSLVLMRCKKAMRSSPPSQSRAWSPSSRSAAPVRAAW